MIIETEKRGTGEWAKRASQFLPLTELDWVRDYLYVFEEDDDKLWH